MSFSCTYSCTTSTPAREPVLVTFAATWNVPFGDALLGACAIAIENFVYESP